MGTRSAAVASVVLGTLLQGCGSFQETRVRQPQDYSSARTVEEISTIAMRADDWDSAIEYADKTRIFPLQVRSRASTYFEYWGNLREAAKYSRGALDFERAKKLYTAVGDMAGVD